ncbi:hypothetical protein MMC20_002426 [Loxospora ochrophaea]|nr:hypothetical protein [Loxospora ochrophaea]
MSAPTLFPCTLDPPHNLFYDPGRQLLSGTIKGSSDDNIVGVYLSQDTFLGGLKFSLLGQYNGIPAPTPSKFQPKLELPIRLPMYGFNNTSVIIVTGSEPEGIEYTILYGGLKDGVKKTPENGTPLHSSSAGPALHVGSVLPPVKVTALDGIPFEIKASADVGQTGTVDLKFSSDALKLTGAKIVATDIVWTLVAQDGYMGETLVDVTRNFWPTPSVTPYNVVQPYLVRVVVL